MRIKCLLLLALAMVLLQQDGRGQTQESRDSILQLIAVETTDSTKLKLLTTAIRDLDFKTKEEIESYFKRGSKLSTRVSAPALTMELFLQTAHRFVSVNEFEEAIGKYQSLGSLASEHGSKKYLAHAILGEGVISYRNGQTEAAQEFVRETLEILEGSNEFALTALALAKMAGIERILGNPRKALNLLDQSEEFFAKETDTPNYLELLNVRGRIYRSLGKYDSARTTYGKVIRIAQEENLNGSLARGFNNLGNIEQLKGDLEASIEYYMKSLEIKETLGDERGIALAFLNIGGIKTEMKLHPESIKYYRKSNSLAKSIKYTRVIQLTNVKIGSAYNELGQIDSALIYHNKALDIARESKDKRGISLCYINLSEDYSKLNDFNKSIDYLTEALNIAYETKNISYQGAALSYIAEAYLNAKEYNENNPDAPQVEIRLGEREIENYLLEAKRIADEVDNFEGKEISLSGLHRLYSENKNYKADAAILEEHLMLKDSIFSRDRTTAIADWETKYETAEKEKEIVVLEASEERSAASIKFWSIVSTLLFLIVGIGSYLYIQLQKTRKRLVIQNDELKELSQLKDKFFGIIAHDIRSPIVALENVDEQMDYYLKKENTAKLTKLGSLVGKTARHLNSLLDNLLNWALVQTNSIPYHPEQLNVSKAWEETAQLLQANAEVKDIELSAQIEPKLEVYADKPSFNTILRNLTSNALKFSRPNSTITFIAARQNGHISLAVKDEGIGMSKDKVASLFTLEKKSQQGTAGEKGTGLGLILCKDLVELNKGNLSVESEEEKGSIFYVKIPAHA